MSSLPAHIDPIGHAVMDYFKTSKEASIRVLSDIASTDRIPASYLFRQENDMPPLETMALSECRGKILDVGAAAGCHSLILQGRGADITALEISGLCCEVMQKLGIENVLCDDFYHQKENHYDTLLMMMNGIGLAGTLEGLGKLLIKSRHLLRAGGQIIFDSSDIEYLYVEEDGSRWINLNSRYYGELTYTLQYKKITGKPFPWLFIDPKTLGSLARKGGFSLEVIAWGDHYDYLGILRKK